MEANREPDHASRPVTYRPWEELPPEAIAIFTPLLPSITEEIIETLRAEVPPYAKPLEGEFGRTVRLGVEQALAQFAELVSHPGSTRATGRAVYVNLGRGELRAGRSIGALLAAYRVGARVAWRRLSDAGVAAGLPQETLNRLAESIFAYIDELSAESAEGYALEQAERAGDSERRAAELIELLVRQDRPPDPASLTAAAEAAHWRLPANLVVVVWPRELGTRPLVRLPRETIATERQRAGAGRFVCAIVPDPQGPGRKAELLRGLDGIRSGIGSVVLPEAAAQSFRHAAAAFDLAAERAWQRPVLADEHRAALLCRADRSLVNAVSAQRLAPLDVETPRSRERLEATLLAWLRHDGNVPAAAAELHVHAQTVRYRVARLRELLGDALDDPDARFELEVALRATA